MCSVAVLVLASTASRAQDTPDLSGQWVLESPAPSISDVPLALSIRQSLVRTAVRREATKPFFIDIIVDRDFATGTLSETLLIGVTGGVVPGLRADGSPNACAASYCR